jgi:hypothetical protein
MQPHWVYTGTAAVVLILHGFEVIDGNLAVLLIFPYVLVLTGLIANGIGYKSIRRVDEFPTESIKKMDRLVRQKVLSAKFDHALDYQKDDKKNGCRKDVQKLRRPH